MSFPATEKQNCARKLCTNIDRHTDIDRTEKE